MERENYIEWIINWFKEKTEMSCCDLEINFFTNGLLNSFQTLELVMDIESSLKLSLPDSALTDARFSSINGLSDILYEIDKGLFHVK